MSIRRSLLAWYDAHARDLPWRRTRDPYAIWVSEVMLQQTRVETVIGYWQRFLDRFPTVDALARAREDDVLARWSGLGYYRRARLLHAGAREVVARHGGRFPEDREARLALPGIGRYTAGAIGSIAFDLPEPVVDGNVARVLSRVHALAAPAGDPRFWPLAARVVRGPRPGALNQALMDLGATVCMPHSPRCDECPIARHCGAHRTDRVGELPPPRPRREPRLVRLVAVVARAPDGAAWMTRTTGSLFGGLWAVPTAEGHGRSAARAALEAAGLRARLSSRAVARLEHVLTHRRLDVQVWRATAPVADASQVRRAVAPEALAHLGTSTLTRRILAT